MPDEPREDDEELEPEPESDTAQSEPAGEPEEPAESSLVIKPKPTNMAGLYGALSPNPFKGIGADILAGVPSWISDVPSWYSPIDIATVDLGVSRYLADMPELNFGIEKYLPMMPEINLDMARLLDGMPKFDTASLFPSMPAMVTDIFGAGGFVGLMDPHFERINSMLKPVLDLIGQDALDRLFPDVDERTTFPDNWAIDLTLDWDEILEIVLNEALPLAWVPRAATLEAILSAESPAARRRVYANRWRSIVTDCEVQLQSIPDTSLGADYRDFGLMVVRGIRDGHHQLAQSMSVNLFDSALQRQMQERYYKNFINQNRRPDLNEFSVKRTLVLGAIWASYLHFRPNAAAKIPRALSRHASAHGVSRKQYTRANAVIALGHVTGLLSLFEAEGWNV